MKETYKTNNSTIKALIIEDAEINAIVLEKALDKFDVSSTHVVDSKAAEEALSTGNYDIVFLDHYLTAEHSGALLASIKTKYPKIPVIAYTASIYTLGNIKDFLKLFPYDDIITKPFTPTHIERMLKQRFEISIGRYE